MLIEKTEKLCETCWKEKKGKYKKNCVACYHRFWKKKDASQQSIRASQKKRREESKKIACVSCRKIGSAVQSMEKKICRKCIYRKKREEEREIKRLCDIKRLI